ncbi:MAG: BatD family protein [Verrucomicrobiota bacterium]|nr:BatD family protein [Verrucomicrobiota bacterium]
MKFRSICIAALLASAALSRAADVSVTAELSRTETDVGEPVRLEIKVSGVRSAKVPDDIAVDGLQITRIGQSTQVQMNNFNLTTSVLFTYNVLPIREGKFVIPAQTIEAGGLRLTTAPLRLAAAAGGASGGGSSGGGANSGKAARLAFAELVVPRQSVYVGEAIPIELRIYVDTRVRWNTEQPPTIGGDGFTIQKFDKPSQNSVSKDGRVYDLVTFKTAITPIKTGKLSLGPAELPCTAQMPQQRRSRPRGGLDDFFNDNFFNDPFGSFAVTQQITIRSDAVPIEVKPLPPNQPKSFSGAVGQFDVAMTASPLKLKTGDPITMKIDVSGRGNFDRVNGPQLTDESGWRTYPPSAKFIADDDVGISGKKSFEMAVIPNEQKTTLPELQFTYFDPLQEKYVTKRTAKTAIEVEVQPAGQQPNVVPQGASQLSATPVAQTPRDIHYLRVDEGRWVSTLEPAYRERAFWLVQLVPAVALACLLGAHVAGTRRRNLAANRAGELRHQKDVFRKTLRDRGASDVDFLDAARRFIQADVALATNQAPHAVDGELAVTSRPLDQRIVAEVRDIFSASDDLRYSGQGSGSCSLSQEKRAEIVSAINEFENHHAK